MTARSERLHHNVAQRRPTYQQRFEQTAAQLAPAAAELSLKRAPCRS
jgi:hypothetical protein